MDQQSADWLRWRNKGIGASDSPAILGVSPYRTPYQVWEEKTGRGPNEQEINFGIRRGIELEPKARAMFELEHDIDMPAKCFEHSTFPWIRASLDGWNEEARAILEIKCAGQKDHTSAKMGDIPEKYYWQLVHQILVTDAKEVYYYSFDGEQGVTIHKHASFFKKDIAKLLKKLSDFYNHIKKDIPPSYEDKDFKFVNLKGKKKCFDELLQSKVDLIGAIKRYRQAEEKALEGMPTHDRMRCGDIKMISRQDHYEFIFPEKINQDKKTACPLMDLWNEHCGVLAKIRGLSGSRATMAKTRWREKPDEKYWIDTIKIISSSAFCNGDNNYKWTADFDWLTKPTTHLKVAEGKYSNKINVDLDSLLDDE